MRNCLISRWITEDVVGRSKALNCRWCLLDSLPLITWWMAWKLGNGCKVNIGKYPLVGGEDFHLLSNKLNLIS